MTPTHRVQSKLIRYTEEGDLMETLSSGEENKRLVEVYIIIQPKDLNPRLKYTVSVVTKLEMSRLPVTNTAANL